MKPLVTKAEILAWYGHAKNVLNLRHCGRHLSGRLSDADFEAYTRSIEDYFKKMKKEFNRKLEVRKCQGR